MTDAPARFAVLDAKDPVERRQWLEAWDEWPAREPSAHPAYVELFAAEPDQALCALLRTDGGAILYPFVLRPLGALPWAAGEDGGDVTTPYGYGGAFHWGRTAATRSGADEFWAAYGAWARERAVVSSFARLSLFPEEILPFPGTVRDVQRNIVRPLDPDDDALWMDYEHKVRKNVKRARTEGVTTTVDLAGEQMPLFADLYLETMARRDASASYRFDLAFFEALAAHLRGSYALFFAHAGGVAVSAELVLLSPTHAYSFLGGTRAAAFPLRPNDLLKHEIIRWARETGRTHFVLGGGFRPDDGIFRYKRAFAPRGEVMFRVGEWTHDVDRYGDLVAKRAAAEPAWTPESGFYPAYRG